MHTESQLAQIGSTLKKQRETLGLSLEQVAAETKVRRKYLLMIEQGELISSIAPVYQVAYIRCYASLLGLDTEALAQMYRGELELAGVIETDEVYHQLELESQPAVSEKNVKVRLQLLVILVVLAVLAGGVFILVKNHKQGSLQQDVFNRYLSSRLNPEHELWQNYSLQSKLANYPVDLAVYLTPSNFTNILNVVDVESEPGNSTAVTAFYNAYHIQLGEPLLSH